MIIGIDVSKDKLDICVLPGEKHYQIKNSAKSIQQFFNANFKQLGCLETIKMVVFEPTGGYEKWLHIYMIEQALPYHLVHPTRAHYFAKMKGFKAKTDKLDSAMLAQYGDQDGLETSSVKTRNQLELQELSARKCQVKAMLQQERHRLGATLLSTFAKRSIKRNIKQLERELALIVQELEQLIIQDEKLESTRNVTKTMKGIGPEISTGLVTQLPELGKVSREAIVSLVGIAPQTKDSGKKKGYRAIGHGRAQMRRLLYMGAMVAIQHDMYFKNFYGRLVEKGKCHKVAIVAVMRKMIITLNTMVKNNTTYQPKQI
jgi:transposase